jgi:hypothetical protein
VFINCVTVKLPDFSRHSPSLMLQNYISKYSKWAHLNYGIKDTASSAALFYFVLRQFSLTPNLLNFASLNFMIIFVPFIVSLFSFLELCPLFHFRYIIALFLYLVFYNVPLIHV